MATTLHAVATLEWVGKLKYEMMVDRFDDSVAREYLLHHLLALLDIFTVSQNVPSGLRVFEQIKTTLGPITSSNYQRRNEMEAILIPSFAKMMGMYRATHDDKAGWRVWKRLVQIVENWNTGLADESDHLTIPSSVFSTALLIASRIPSAECVRQVHGQFLDSHSPSIPHQIVSILITAYSRVGEPSAILDILSSTETRPSAKHLTALVTAYQRSGDVTTAKRVWTEHLRVHPDADTYAAVIVAAGFARLGKRKEVRDVEEWVRSRREFVPSGKPRLLPTEVVTSSAIRTLRSSSKNGRKAARQSLESLTATLLNMMDNSELRVDEFLCGEIALAWFSQEDAEGLWNWLTAVEKASERHERWKEEQRARKLSRNSNADGASHRHHPSSDAQDTTTSQPVPPATAAPSFFAYDLLLRLCIRTHSLSLFDNVVRHMKSRRPSPVPMYRPTIDALISFHWRARDVSSMRHVYETAVRSDRWQSVPGYRSARKMVDSAAVEAWREGGAWGYERMGSWWREVHREGNVGDVEGFEALVEGVSAVLMGRGDELENTQSKFETSRNSKEVVDELLDMMEDPKVYDKGDHEDVAVNDARSGVSTRATTTSVFRKDSAEVQDHTTLARPMTVLETTYFSLLSLFPPKVTDSLPVVVTALRDLLKELGDSSETSELLFLANANSHLTRIITWIETGPKVGDLSQIRAEAWKRDLVVRTVIPAILDMLSTRRRGDLLGRAMGILMREGAGVVLGWDVADFYKDDLGEWRKAIRRRISDDLRETAMDRCWEAYVRGLVWCGDLGAVRKLLSSDLSKHSLILLWHLLLRLQHQLLHFRVSRRAAVANRGTYLAPKRFQGTRDKRERAPKSVAATLRRQGSGQVLNVPGDEGGGSAEADAYDPLAVAFVERSEWKNGTEQAQLLQKLFRDLTVMLGEGTTVVGVLAGGKVSAAREEPTSWFTLQDD
ncbi:hypothetical protein HDU93_007129 [Gonapodya sp. JEL0774]|nr:hypothetical protein HDU93_007129 [Gonapodya sp. JEL0774]